MLKVFAASVGLHGLNIGIIRLMKLGKGTHALEWAYSLEKCFNVKMVEQMLF